MGEFKIVPEIKETVVDKEKPEDDKTNGEASKLLKDDYMLYEALNLLKGLSILQARVQ